MLIWSYKRKPDRSEEFDTLELTTKDSAQFIRLEGHIGLHKKDKEGHFLTPNQPQPDGSNLYQFQNGLKVKTQFDEKTNMHSISVSDMPEGKIPEIIALAIRLETAPPRIEMST